MAKKSNLDTFFDWQESQARRVRGYHLGVRTPEREAFKRKRARRNKRKSFWRKLFGK